MKKLKIFWLMLGFLFSGPAIHAQSGLTIEATQMYATFKFTDASGNNLTSEYLGVFSGAYKAGYRYVMDNGLMFRAGLGIRNAGANMVYDNMNYNWDLRYADANLGVGYMLKIGGSLKPSMASPYLTVSGYYSYLLNGIQTINNEDFNIKNSKSINDMDYGVLFTPGVQFNLSGAVLPYIEFNYLWGLQNIEKDERQTSSNVAYQLTIGITFSFSE